MGVPMDQIASQLNVDRRVVEDIFSRSIGNVNTEIIGSQRPPMVQVPPANIPFDDNIMVSPSMVMPMDIGVPSFGEDDVERPDRRPPMRMFQDNETLLDIADQSANPEIVNIVHGVVGESEEKDEIIKTLEDFDKNATKEDEAVLDSVEQNLNKGVNENDENKILNNIEIVNLLNELNKFDEKEKIKAYREVVDNMYADDPDLEKLIGPDKALPFQLAGLALIRAGGRGETVGEAADDAFAAYLEGSIRNRQEVKSYKVSRELEKRKLVSQLYLADVQSQFALAKELATEDKDMYVFTDKDGDQKTAWFSKKEFNQHLKDNPNSGIRSFSETRDGKIQPFTFYNPEGLPMVLSLTQSQAENLVAKDNDFVRLEVGNIYDKGQPYRVTRNGEEKIEILTKEQFAALSNESGVEVVALKGTPIRVFDTLTLRNGFALPDEIAQNKGRYMPIDNSFDVVTNADGSMSISQGSSGTLQFDKRMKDIREFVSPIYINTGKVLDLVDRTNKLIDKGDLILGTTGALASGFKRLVNESNNLVSLFGTKNYDFEYDGEKVSFEQFRDQFFEENKKLFGSSFLDRAVASGSDQIQLRNLQFQLALAFAMSKGQKGRDISDKDLAFHLRNVGQNLSSVEDLKNVLDQLEVSTIDNLKASIESQKFIQDPVYRYGKEYDTYEEFMEPKYNEFRKEYQIDARLTRLEGKDGIPSSSVGTGKVITTGNIEILQGGDQPSGDGDLTVHQVFMTDFYPAIASNDNRLLGKMLAKYYDVLGKDSPEYQALKEYIDKYRNKLLKDE